MFQKIVRFLIFVFFKIVLSVRYRVKVKGLEKLSPENLKSPGGVLFLPNHSSVFVDPTIITLALFGKFPIRPIIVEYMFYTPIVNRLMRILNALPIPDLRYTANSIKRKRTKKILEKIAEGLNEGDNFLIYPAGRVKLSRYESVAGASGVHTILSMRPEANVVLVRSEGLYGSIFSTALTGKVEPMFGGIFRGIKIALKNLIFFGPRREITLEFMPAPADFPRTASRIELNHWLEVWYNRPYETLHDTSPPKELPGEQVYLVPHSLWSSDVPKIDLKRKEETDIDLDAVPEGVRHRIYEKVALLANRNQATLDDATDLAQDLGLDSLDGAELIAFLEEEFSITGVPPQELTTSVNYWGSPHVRWSSRRKRNKRRFSTSSFGIAPSAMRRSRRLFPAKR
ncbi:MAG: 1-acyl-sn-glycerol-3-phosphate acyltransferase [Chlamydiia bacterium]|nr:1-acyl-sn-glycerol-3-phosphate acyltransferase [Chlamydiia bacterium]